MTGDDALASELVLLARRPEDTRALGSAIAKAALPLPTDGLTVGLTGDLGAGKTVFVKGVGEGLGVGPDVCVVSPTFTIARSYDGAAGIRLHHIDAYRLGGAAELEDVGFEEMCGPGCLTCVEWAERVRRALPEDRVEVTIIEAENDVRVAPGAAPEIPRRVSLVARGSDAARVLGRLAVPPMCEED